MDEFERDLDAAGDALAALADGPAQDAADAISRSFGQAGASIEAALAGAARTGELDFRNMAESILRDLARVAAEAVLTGDAVKASTGGVTMNLNLGPGADANSVLSNRAAISTALARAASAGGRFL